MYLTVCLNNVSNWGEPTTLARRMHVPKSPCLKLPLRHGCVCRHPACTQKKCACRACATLYFVIKSQVYLKCPFQIRQFFSVTSRPGVKYMEPSTSTSTLPYSKYKYWCQEPRTSTSTLRNCKYKYKYFW